VSDQARLLFGRRAANDQIGKAFSDLRGEVWHVDRVTGLERVPQTLLNEIVYGFTQMGISHSLCCSMKIMSLGRGGCPSGKSKASAPLVDAMKVWFETELSRVPPRGGLAEAIRYALTRWSALCRFLDDGRIELDNNTVERAIRPIALGRKNHLFAGSDGGAARWATVASLLATAKLNGVEPFAYLKDVLERLSNGHPMSRLDDLLPWNWAPSIAAAP